MAGDDTKPEDGKQAEGEETEYEKVKKEYLKDQNALFGFLLDKKTAYGMGVTSTVLKVFYYLTHFDDYNPLDYPWKWAGLAPTVT